MASGHYRHLDDPVGSIHQRTTNPRPSTSVGIQHVWHRRTGISVDAYTRHKQLINNYVLFHQGATNKLKRDESRDKNDYDVIRENHKFLWENIDDSELTWEAKLAKRYYDKLFKEYCIADLSRYKENKVAMRWRIEKEVRSGKGQFHCGNKCCEEMIGLESWEVNFAYKEDGNKKNALVKLRLCPKCSEKLNYYSQKRKAVKKTKKPSNKKMRKRRHSEEDDEESDVPIKKEIKEEPLDDYEGQGSSGKEKSPPKENPDDIWSKPKEIIDEETAREQQLDAFLDDLLF